MAVIVDKKSESFIREGLPPSAALLQPITINTMNPMTEQELLQVPEELRELFIALDKQGWNPQLCDTLVPYYANGVPCGYDGGLGQLRLVKKTICPIKLLRL